METNNDSNSGGMTYKSSKPLILTSKNPCGRGGVSVVLSDRNLVSFGGHWFGADNKFCYSDETWVLSIEGLSWHLKKCLGALPGPRYGHTAHIIGARMFIFGGKGPNGIFYDQVFFLDLIEWTWVPVETVPPGPEYR